MLINKAQTYLPWIALVLCVLVVATYVVTRPPTESYDQCLARQAHPAQTAEDRRDAEAACGKLPHVTKPVVGS